MRVTSCSASFLISFLAATAPLSISRAQPPVLRFASDVPGALILPNSSTPGPFLRSGSTVYFGAANPSLGRELWALDSSVHLVKDIAAGSANGVNMATGMAPLPGNRALFVADDGLGAGAGLWVTDGTSAGTRPLHTQSNAPAITFNSTGSRPFGLLPDGRVLFNGYDPATGFELWATDGTDAHTAIVADLSPGASYSIVTFLHNAGPLVYFSLGGYLWRTDGTAAGTVSMNVYANNPKFVTIGAYSYFVSDADPGLWRTNGVAGATTRILSVSAVPGELAAIGTNLIFSVSDPTSGTELWRYDTASSTSGIVADLAPGALSSDPHYLTSIGSQALFVANAGGGGREPWVTDGTAAGTHILADLNPGTSDSMLAIDPFVSDGVHTFFPAFVPPSVTFFSTDGTFAGTRALVTLPPNTAANAAITGTFLPDNSGRILFQGSDAASGVELWISDGTPLGTHLHTDIATGSSSVPINRSYRQLSQQHAAVGLNGTLYFPATVPGSAFAQSALAAATADAGSARLIRTFRAGVTELAAHSGRIYFPADDSTTGTELWSSDGTIGGTALVADIAAQASSFPRSLTSVGNKLFCAAAPNGSSFTPSNAPCTLFAATDGLPGAPQVVSNAASGLPRLRITEQTSAFAPEALISALGRAFFVASTNPASSSGPYAALVSDGTDQGTVQLAQVASRTKFVEWNGRVYFTGYAPSTSTTYLQSTDGTSAGTTLVVAVASSAIATRATSDRLYLTITDAQGISQLWTLDHNSTTLRQVTTFTGIGGYAGYASGVVLGERLIFSGGDAATGFEPWVTDGSVAGTFRLADLVPGPGASHPTAFTVVRSTVYFVASAPDSIGTRLYQTDGTVAGTFAVPIAPGSQTISPFALTDQSLAQTNGRFYVIAANPAAQQVWYLDTCFADFDASGQIEVGDIFGYVNAWLAQDPHADTNADGQLTVDDIFSYIQLWFTGCT